MNFLTKDQIKKAKATYTDNFLKEQVAIGEFTACDVLAATLQRNGLNAESFKIDHIIDVEDRKNQKDFSLGYGDELFNIDGYNQKINRYDSLEEINFALNRNQNFESIISKKEYRRALAEALAIIKDIPPLSVQYQTYKGNPPPPVGAKSAKAIDPETPPPAGAKVPGKHWRTIAENKATKRKTLVFKYCTMEEEAAQEQANQKAAKKETKSSKEKNVQMQLG